VASLWRPFSPSDDHAVLHNARPKPLALLRRFPLCAAFPRSAGLAGAQEKPSYEAVHHRDKYELSSDHRHLTLA